MDRLMLFDILYALLTADGRQESLFGNSRDIVRTAFAKSLAGTAFPQVWFEAPLAGEPWLDVHSLVWAKDVKGKAAAYAGHDGVYADALTWFASQDLRDVRQLALSYDTSAGNVDTPAIQVLLDGYGTRAATSFLETVGRADATCAYQAFAGAMPSSWYPCYVGVFPAREASWVRVECLQNNACKALYADDVSAIERDLARVGLEKVDKSMLLAIRDLARTPYALELQLNMGMDGRALPAVSASVSLGTADWTDPERGHALQELAGWAMRHGLADERLGQLPDCAFAKRVAHGGSAVRILCHPAFLKVRWRAGHALDAKTYLLARVKEET